MQKQLFEEQRSLDIAYVGNHGLKLQGFLNGNQRKNLLRSEPTKRPFANWPSDITEALNEFLLQLQLPAGAV